MYIYVCIGLPRRLSGEESACHAGDLGLLSESGRSPAGGSANPLKYSGLENSMDRGAWRATVHSITRHQTRLKQLNTYMCENESLCYSVVIDTVL